MTTGPMIRQRQRAAADNTEHLRDTLAAMQRAGQQINVSTVAKASGLSPHTIRSRTDIYDEIKRIREQESTLPPVKHTNTRDTARWKDLEGRWKDAMRQVSDLKVDNTNLRRQVEQQLCDQRPNDQSDHDQATTEIALLKAERSDLQSGLEQLQQSCEDKEIEAENAHKINRAYVHWFNSLPPQVHDEHPFKRPSL